MGFFEDLATNPTYQGIGIFIGLILAALAILIPLRMRSHKKTIPNSNEKPEFQLINIDPFWRREKPERVRFRANLKNLGSVPAREVRISYEYLEQKPSLRQLTQSSDEIKKQSVLIDGTINPNSLRNIGYQKEWELRHGKLWVIVWLQYKYDQKQEECVFISHVIGSCTDGQDPIFYSNDDLIEDKQKWDSLISGKDGL